MCLLKKLGIQYPIVQAPMAGGITTPQLVSEVSNCGGLGFIGAGMLAPEEIALQIKEVKKNTRLPFGINLFYLPDIKNLSRDDLLESIKYIEHRLGGLGINYQFHIPEFWAEPFRSQVEAILADPPPIVSFTFGIPPVEILNSFKKKNIKIIGTATTVKEAQLWDSHHIDAICLQGIEAGGHRGSLPENEYSEQLPLMPLLTLVKRAAVKTPIIASGGIMTGEAILATQILGAQAAQLGTAFLCADESGASKAYKNAVKQFKDRDTQLTRVFTGKFARGISNQWIQTNKDFEAKAPSYPYTNILTKYLRNWANHNDQPEFISLWAGQCFQLAETKKVREIISQLIEEYQLAKSNL